MYSHDEIQEILKCSEDPAYFIETYCVASSTEDGKVKMRLKARQKNWIASAKECQITELGHDRQDGKTQFMSAYAAWISLFQPDQTIVILANKHITAKLIRTRIIQILSELPEFLRPVVKAFTSTYISFENGTRILVGGITESACKGMTINTLMLDNWEHTELKVFQAFSENHLPVLLATRTKIIMTGRNPWQL